MPEDLLLLHTQAMVFHAMGITKSAAATDLHFSGRLQVNRYQELVVQVPSGLLRGYLDALRFPGAELHQPHGTWEPAIVVMTKEELAKVGGPSAISERGKEFDYRFSGSKDDGGCHCYQKAWYLEAIAPDLVKLRQAYGLPGEPEKGFRAYYGGQRTGLFRDGDKVKKRYRIAADGLPIFSDSAGHEWTLWRPKQASAPSAVLIKGNPVHFPSDGTADRFYQKIRQHLASRGYSVSDHDGSDHSEPPLANVWVGHSRGAGRFDYAPPGVLTIPIGSHRAGAINHPDDKSFSGGPVGPAHFIFDSAMATALDARLGRKTAALNEDVRLQPHQKALSDEIDEEHPARKLLYWGTGSGKTLGSMAAAETYGQPYTVVGPAAVRPTFKNEQKRFTDQSLPSSVISYQRATQEGGIPHPDSLVIDEAQRISNPGTRQSQAVQEAARKAKQVLLLSGTPIVNRPGDLAPAFGILTGRETTPDAFEQRYMGEAPKPRSWAEWLSGKDRKYEPVIRHRDELKALLAGKVDWYAPDKPMVETRHSSHEVEMGEDQARLYRAMFGRIPWKLRMGMDGSTDLSPKELQQLRSFLAGPRQVGLSDYPFARHKDPYQSFQNSTKLQKAFELMKGKIDADPRHKGIVYSNFPTAGLHPYRAALQAQGIPHTLFDGTLSDVERDAAVRSFNEGRSRVALVGPAGAEGISLRGAQLLQRLDPHWHSARGEQAAARGIRWDSHTDLPEELRNIEIQNFISKLPAKDRTWLQYLRLAPYQRQPQPAADNYLMDMSDRKARTNKLFTDLLQEVGTRKVAFFDRILVVKQAQLASMEISDECSDCKAKITVTIRSVDHSEYKNCPECGSRNFIYPQHEEALKLIDKACEDTDTHPTDAQRQAGNYRKGKFQWHGLVLAIENPAGTIRRGKSKAGKPWEVKLKDHYGYILKHISEADGDHVDVFIRCLDKGETRWSVDERRCYIVDQTVDGKFDEHKCVVMCPSAKEAKATYLRNYSEGWNGFSNLTTMSLADFKDWLANGDTGKPAFVPVPQSHIDAVKAAIKDLESDGGYGEVILNTRGKTACVIAGDWWEEELVQKWVKAVKKALPDYEVRGEAESYPVGYDETHFGDWARIKK